MTTHTNMGRFENDREATHLMTCEDCILPPGPGCGHKWVITCDEHYVENSHYSYYEARCPACGKVNKDAA
jgi:hypothetical protein